MAVNVFFGNLVILFFCENYKVSIVDGWKAGEKSRYEGVFLWLALHVGMPVGCKRAVGRDFDRYGQVQVLLKIPFL